MSVPSLNFSQDLFLSSISLSSYYIHLQCPRRHYTNTSLLPKVLTGLLHEFSINACLALSRLIFLWYVTPLPLCLPFGFCDITMSWFSVSLAVASVCFVGSFLLFLSTLEHSRVCSHACFLQSYGSASEVLSFGALGWTFWAGSSQAL